MKDIYEFAYASRSKLATHRRRVTIASTDAPGGHAHDTVHAMEAYENDTGFMGLGHSIVPLSSFDHMK